MLICFTSVWSREGTVEFSGWALFSVKYRPRLNLFRVAELNDGHPRPSRHRRKFNGNEEENWVRKPLPEESA